MSSELVWDIVRRESSFVRKFGNVELSAEPLNVVGKNSYKHSGLSQSKAVGVAVVSVKGKGDKVRLLKKAGASNKPNKATVVTYLTHGRPRAGKAVNAATANYRADLNRAAAAKYAALAAGIQKKAKQNGVTPKKKTRRS